jgi:uncharacterized membrane protein YgaE (UPF0421/DUF939 family)
MGAEMNINITLTDLLVIILVSCVMAFGMGYLDGRLERYSEKCFTPVKSIAQLNAEYVCKNRKIERYAK